MNGLVREQIAELISGRACAGRSEEPARIDHVAAIANADQSALVFAETPESLKAALASQAGAILVDQKLESSENPRLIQVANVRYAFALCARELERAAFRNGGLDVHPSAVIADDARLGARVRIGAGAVIGPQASLGDDCAIGARVVIADGVMLGNRVVVQAGAVLGSKGFGYVRQPGSGEYLLFPQSGALVIEDDVEIGANTTVDRGALEETRIGRGTKIDNLVHIGHNCRIGKNVVIAAQVGLSGSCVVEDGAILAGQVGISDHCHIGPGVILGGQAGVYRGKSVMGAGEVFAGTPAEPLRDQMKAIAQVRAMARSRKIRQGA